MENKLVGNEIEKDGTITKDKLDEIRKDWKKEIEEEKVSFREVMKKQIQEETRDCGESHKGKRKSCKGHGR